MDGLVVYVCVWGGGGLGWLGALSADLGKTAMHKRQGQNRDHHKAEHGGWVVWVVGGGWWDVGVGVWGDGGSNARARERKGSVWVQRGAADDQNYHLYMAQGAQFVQVPLRRTPWPGCRRSWFRRLSWVWSLVLAHTGPSPAVLNAPAAAKAIQVPRTRRRRRKDDEAMALPVDLDGGGLWSCLCALWGGERGGWVGGGVWAWTWGVRGAPRGDTPDRHDQPGRAGRGTTQRGMGQAPVEGKRGGGKQGGQDPRRQFGAGGWVSNQGRRPLPSCRVGALALPVPNLRERPLLSLSYHPPRPTAAWGGWPRKVRSAWTALETADPLRKVTMPILMVWFVEKCG